MFYNIFMNILSSYYWEKGLCPGLNEDSIALQQYLSIYGSLAIAIVCDGIGGMAEGETASGFAVEELVKWFHHEFTRLLYLKAGRARLKRSLYRQFYKMNEELNHYGTGKGIQTGTTVSMLLLYQNNYLYAHSGDSRIYSISKRKSKQLTKDHSFKNSVLYRCVGGGSFERPDIGFGRIKKGCGYLICTDGFRHYLKEKELPVIFKEAAISEEKQIGKRLREIGSRAIQRGERDNLSAVYLLCR